MRRFEVRVCRYRLGVPLLLAAAGCLTVAFDVPVLGLLVVGAGFWLAGAGITSAVVPAHTRIDRLLATLTFAFACLAIVAEALSLAVLLGTSTAWIAAAVACGGAGS